MYLSELCLEMCTANPTWGDIFECCFKAQSSKLERLFPLKRGKRDVRALSFELSKMSPQVGLAVHTSASEVYERYVHLYQSCVRAVKMYRSTYVYMWCMYTYVYIRLKMYRRTYVFICMYSLLHMQCTAYCTCCTCDGASHFLSLKSQSLISFSRSLLPRFIKKRPVGWDWRLRLNETLNAIGCIYVCIRVSIHLSGYLLSYLSVDWYIHDNVGSSNKSGEWLSRGACQ